MIGHPLEDKIVDYIDAKSDGVMKFLFILIFLRKMLFMRSKLHGVLQKWKIYAMIVRETLSIAINQKFQKQQTAIHGL